MKAEKGGWRGVIALDERKDGRDEWAGRAFFFSQASSVENTSEDVLSKKCSQEMFA